MSGDIDGSDSGVDSLRVDSSGKCNVLTAADACPVFDAPFIRNLLPLNLVNQRQDTREPRNHDVKEVELRTTVTSLETNALVKNIATLDVKEEDEREYFDIRMIFDKNDRDKVEKFADVLSKFVVLDGGQKPRICIDRFDLKNSFGQLKIRLEEQALENSYCYFVFFSKTSCEKNWKKEFYGCVALEQCIQNKDSHVLVPVVTDNEVRKSISFDALQELNLSKLFTNRRSLDDVDVGRLTEKDLNMAVIRSIAGLLKQGREKNQINKSKEMLHNTDSGKELTKIPQTTTQLMLHSKIIQENFDYLVDCLQTEYGLLTCLYSSETISRRDMEEMEAEKVPYKKTEKLLNFLIRDKNPGSFEKFLDALQQSGQDFIAEKLRENLHPKP